ncbi:hypothetical protein [Acinetobacter sp. WCHAc010052]|nr:hypothetical protein [Acinetobacter sp. WCHAc010052]
MGLVDLNKLSLSELLWLYTSKSLLHHRSKIQRRKIMLSKEDAEKMANEILQKEREKSQSRLAKQSSSIDRIYKAKNLAEVPQYQHILLFRQAKSLAEDHPLYNKCGMAIWYWHCYLSNISLDRGKV